MYTVGNIVIVVNPEMITTDKRLAKEVSDQLAIVIGEVPSSSGNSFQLFFPGKPELGLDICVNGSGLEYATEDEWMDIYNKQSPR
jgi:hypothetical protein